MSKLIYLASPFTSDQKNVEDVRIVANYLVMELFMDSKHLVYSPLAHGYHYSEICKIEKTWEYWRDHCLGMLAKSDFMCVLALEGWEDSVGLKTEIEFAKECEIPVEFLHLDRELKPIFKAWFE